MFSSLNWWSSMEEVKFLLLAFLWCSFRPWEVEKILTDIELYIERTILHMLVN